MRNQSAATPKPVILIVDDVPQNLAMLAGILEARYGVRIASNGATALRLMRASSPPDLVLLDVVMPGMDGYAVCRQLKADPRTRDVPVIFLTVLDDAIDEELGLGLGAVDYIVKPVNSAIMLARIDAQLRLKTASDFLRDENQLLEREVARRMEAAAAEHGAILTMLASLIHERELEGSNHVARVQAYVQALAERMRAAGRLSAEVAALVVKAAPLHDIGMADVPDRILFKPDALTAQEFGIVKMHAERGRAVIERVVQRLGHSTPLLEMAADMASAHQERWDGTGYPGGLAGEAIPIGARLIALVDAYEALVSGRQYRLPVSHTEAVAQLTSQRGRHFDPQVVDAFLAVADAFRDIALSCADAADDAQMRLRAVEIMGNVQV